ncbi:MAG: hypothetical protein UHS49_07385 [Faecalimonas sp.]|nr:hypothetical protein [Faecalimonas sp.]
MELKKCIFFNTLLVVLYTYINSLNEVEGWNAIFLIIIFALGMLLQWIFAALLKPEKMNVLYVLIILIRLAAFLTIPLQRSMYLYMLSIIITFCLDLWQYSHWDLNAVFKTKTYTDSEVAYSKNLAEIAFPFSLTVAALIGYKGAFAIAFIGISFYQAYKIESLKYRIWINIECCISIIFIRLCLFVQIA